MFRLVVWKVQYYWGWDWGLVLMICGLWKVVRFELYEVYLDDLWVDYEVDESLKKVKGMIIVISLDGVGYIVDLIVDYDGKMVFKGIVELDSNGNV